MATRRSLLATATLTPLLGSRPATALDVTPTPDPTEIEVESAVVYGEVDGEELVLDVYRPPARESPRPAVILIHGGGWTEGYGDRSVLAEAAEDLANAGYVAFNTTYRLMTGEPGVNSWSSQLDDVQRAVRWIRANAAAYNVDSERIGSYGYSSGGQLAAFLGVRETRDNSDSTLSAHSSRVTCVADLSGDMDLTIPYPQELDREIVINLLGGTVEEVPDAYRDASPITWVDHESAPFLIIHGASDTTNPVEHSRTMQAALQGAGVEVVYFEDPDADLFTWSWAIAGPWILTMFERHLEPGR